MAITNILALGRHFILALAEKKALESGFKPAI